MIKELSDGYAFWQEIIKRIAAGQRTNLFLSEEEVLSLVDAGKAWRMEFDGGVYIFIREWNCYRLYYFLEKQILPWVLPDLQLPIILEEVAVENKPRMPTEAHWWEVGLQPYLQRKRMYLMAKNIVPELREITFATEDMLTELWESMQSSFEPYTSALPTKEGLLQDILGRKVLVSKNGQVLQGYLHFGETKQGSVLWHIAVLPHAQGKGVASGLVKDWFFAQGEQVKKFLLWVRIENQPALALYEKFGFLPDGRVAPVMIKTTKQRG